MDDEKQNLEEQKSFMQLLKELAETQTTLSKINAQIIIRDGQEQVKEAVDKARENLEDKAKALGVSAKKMEEMYEASKDEKKGILEEYEEALETVSKIYDDGFLNIMETAYGLYQEQEQDTMIEEKETQIKLKQAKKDLARLIKEKKKEIIKATKEGNMDLAKEKIEELDYLSENHEANQLEETNLALQTRREELRKMIEDAEEAIEQHKEDRRKAIEEITIERDNKLAKVSKENFFQKLAGNIFSKFNGSKKFMRTAIDPLKEKVDLIKKETIPQLTDAMNRKSKEFYQKVQEDSEKMQKAVQEKITQHRENKAERKKQIKQFREDTINKAIEMGQSAQNATRNFFETVQFGAETITTMGLNAKDRIVDGTVDKINTAVNMGLDAKDRIVEGTMDKLNEAVTMGINAKDRLIDGTMNKINAANDMRKSAIGKGKRTYRGIIEFGHKKKLGLINRMQRKLNEKQKQLEEKMKTFEEPKEIEENENEPRE